MKENPQQKEVAAEASAIISHLDTEASTELLETVLNTTYPGLTLYVRDTNLSDEQRDAYYPGQIILELAYTECSSFGKGGVPTNCRYTILSNHMCAVEDMLAGEQSRDGTDWADHGLFICKRNSHFMVLDIYSYAGKTQILLLHLPDYELWKFFSIMNPLENSGEHIGHDVELVQQMRQSFEERCLLPADPRISCPEVLEEWDFPLGMDEEGEWFDIRHEVPDYTYDETLPPDTSNDEAVRKARMQMGTVLRIIDETYIAGSSYVDMDKEEYEMRFFENRPLSLILEPENQYDKKAVRIEDAEHVKLGYLPRAVNDIPYRLLYGGYELYAYPLAIGSETKGQEYHICVYMEIAKDKHPGKQE